MNIIDLSEVRASRKAALKKSIRQRPFNQYLWPSAKISWSDKSALLAFVYFQLS